MTKTTMPRKLLALAAIVPLAVTGLAGCQSDSGPAERPKSTKTNTKAPSGGEGGGLPFEGETEAPPSTSAAPTTKAPTQSPKPTTTSSTPTGGGGGTDTVKWDGSDFSSLDWDVTCSFSSGNTDTYIDAVEAGKDRTDPKTPSMMITAEPDGRITFLYVDVEDDATSLWYSENTTSDASAGGTLTSDGTSVTASGTGHAYNDYSYKTPLSFEITLACDKAY